MMAAYTKQARDGPLPRLQLIADLEAHVDRAWQLSWSPTEPVLASCGADKVIRLHRYRLPGQLPGVGKHVRWHTQATLESGHARAVRSLAWSTDGSTLATGSFDSTIGVWEQLPPEDTDMDADDVEENCEWECIGTLEGHDSEVKGVAFSHDGTLLASCGRDKSVWIWEAHADSDYETLSVLMEHSQDVKAVAWHPCEELLASASYDDTIKIYADDPSDDWFVLQSLTGHTSTVWSIAFSPCGQFIVSGSDDRTVRIWRRLSEHQARLQGLSPNKRWACTNVLRGWHVRPVLSVSWSTFTNSTPDLGLIASTGADGNIIIYQVVSLSVPFCSSFDPDIRTPA